MARALALLVLLAALAGCLTGTWKRDTSDAPVQEPTVEEFVLGTTELQTVLDALGAPIEVWEHERDGIAMAYGWFESRSFEIKVRAMRVDSADDDLDLILADQEGLRQAVVFYFDPRCRLAGWRRGLLEDLLAERVARPSVPMR